MSKTSEINVACFGTVTVCTDSGTVDLIDTEGELVVAMHASEALALGKALKKHARALDPTLAK